MQIGATYGQLQPRTALQVGAVVKVEQPWIVPEHSSGPGAHVQPGVASQKFDNVLAEHGSSSPTHFPAPGLVRVHPAQPRPTVVQHSAQLVAIGVPVQVGPTASLAVSVGASFVEVPPSSAAPSPQSHGP